MSKIADVAIIGAGPYGLSLAAHLRARGISYRIFGKPMDFWHNNMPKGMQLKSEGFASDLDDPKGDYTLKRYSAEHRIQYADRNYPIPVEVFTDYGRAFQEKLVPNLERQMVTSVVRENGNFTLRLDNGDDAIANRVVVAVGCLYFQYLPSGLAHLPRELATHSAHHHDLERFRGRTVAVVGGGSSAIDLAVLLHEQGANVQLIARSPSLNMHGRGNDKRSLFEQIRRPLSGIGPGWRLYFYHHAPWLFYRLPEALRRRIVQRTLGPAAGWFMKERVMGRVPLILGHQVETAAVQGESVRLNLRALDGTQRVLMADHVIAATGYKVDVARLNFLSSALLSKIATVAGTPVLSRNLESSVPGLHFIGIAAANSFGPVMRFACGAGFPARTLAQCIAP